MATKPAPRSHRLVIACAEKRLPRERSVDPTPTVAETSAEPLPPELRAELRRLLAAIFVADYRADLQGDTGATVAPPSAHNRPAGDSEAGE